MHFLKVSVLGNLFDKRFTGFGLVLSLKKRQKKNKIKKQLGLASG
jgi:hypothetical protein